MVFGPVAAVARPAFAAFVGLLLGVGLTALAGEEPLTVLSVIWHGAFGSAYDLGMTLFYATPLIFTGLAVALPFQAGLFNIGAEGQLTVGALAAAAVGICWKVESGVVGCLVAGLAAAFAGGLWGAIAGWLKAARGGHEVISTIMLNFIAAGLTSWAALYLLPSHDSQNPETARVGEGYLLHKFEFFSGAPVTVALPLALAAAICVWIFLKYAVAGFETKAVGINSTAARVGGVAVKTRQIWALALAGALAGLVGVAEVLGNSGRFRIGFSPEYGFIGIPVALLALSHPLGVILAALLFGALQKGTAELDLETTFVTRDLSLVIQALVVVAVSAEGGLRLWRLRSGGKNA